MKTLARSRDNSKTIYGLVAKLESRVDQSLNMDSSPTFDSLTLTNDIIVGGNMTVNGMTTVINTDVVEIKDNIIEINSSETGSGITLPSGVSGIQINRGISSAYQFVFRESDDSFTIGELGNLQVVATREDVPLDKGIMVFDDVNKRLNSTVDIESSITFSSTELSNTSSSGAIRVAGGVGVAGDISLDQKLYLKGTTYDNYIYTTAGQDTIVNSIGGLHLDVATNVKIPTSKPIIFSSNAHSISSDAVNLSLGSSGAINLQANSVNLNISSPLTFGTSSNKITYDSTDMILDASGSFVINSNVSVTDTTPSTSYSSGSIVSLGGVSIANSTDAISSSIGGAASISGGLGLGKKLFVGGLSVFENLDELRSVSVSGGASISKKLVVGSNYSGNPSSTPGIFIQSPGYTFTDSNTTENGNVSMVPFNYLGINALDATNLNITTDISSTLCIEGAPIAGTNQTVNNLYSLFIHSGTSRFGGDIQSKSTAYSTSIIADGGVTINKNLNVNSKFNVSADIPSPPTSTGVFIALDPSTVTDDVTVSGTVPEMMFNVIAQPTLSSTNVITTTDTATFVLDGEPIQAGNQTLTNSYSMLIKSGTFRTDSDIKILDVLEAVDSSSGGSLNVAGGVGIQKKLFVAGVSNFENVLDSSSSTVGGTVVGGGLSVSKNTTIGKSLVAGSDDFSEPSGLGKVFKSGGSEFTDSVTSASGTQTVFSTNEFKRSTLSSTNGSVTTTDAYNVYIEGPTIQGTNQTITNNYSLAVGSGKSLFMGDVDITGILSTSNDISIQGGLDVNGTTTLDQVTIVTDDGLLSVTGNNSVSINVGDSCTMTNTSGNITLDSQAGELIMVGNSSMSLDSPGGISIDAGASSNVNTSVGTMNIGGPTVQVSGDNIDIQSTTSMNIGTTGSGLPINIGNSISETTIGDNLTVVGNLTVRGESTILDATLITTEDNAIVVNSMPAGISDGGLIIKRYQTPNNTSLGSVIEDVPYETGAFQGDLILGVGASVVVDQYKGWWIKITSGLASGYVRRINTSDASRVITVYVTADNGPNFSDGLDIGVVIQAGDTYELYPGAHVGMFFNETLDEFSIGKVPHDVGAGVFPLFGYSDLHIKSLIVDSGLELIGTTSVQGNLLIDTDDTMAMYIRKDGDSGDVFIIDSVNSIITLENPSSVVNSESVIKLSGKDSVDLDVLYSQITSRVKVNTTTAVGGELSLGVVRNSILENYIVLDSTVQKTIISSLVDILNTTPSTSTSASLKVSGGITSLVADDAISSTSGGGITTVGGASIGKTLYTGSDPFFNSSGTGNGIITIGPSSQNGESSLSFYGDLSYSGQLWKIGHGLPGSSLNNFGVYNGVSSSFALTIGTTNIINVVSAEQSVSTSTGALVVAGGVGVNGNLNVGGNVTGTWVGNTVQVANGGTGATSHVASAILLGNGTSSIQSGLDLVYSSSTLTLPKISSTDTTDSSSVGTGAIILGGGMGIAKTLYVGLGINNGGDIRFTGVDAQIGNTSVDGSDNSSVTIHSGGVYGNTRGAGIILKGNEHASDAGIIVLDCGNVNSTGYLRINTANIERFRIGYDGVITSYNPLDATGPTAASFVVTGGLAVSKKLNVGTDAAFGGNISMTSVTSGAWNASIIDVAYGGTGASTLASNSVLIGNGTSAIQTDAGFTFSTNTLVVPRLSSTDTSQSTSSSTGSVTLLGGMGVAKNVFLGEGLRVNDFIGVGVTTNINSAITLASGSNIGVNTLVGFDSGNLSISGSGVALPSRGSLVSMYGVNHATLAGELNLQAGTSVGDLKLSTGGTPRVNITNAGVVSITKTGDTTSNTTGSLVVTGGVAITNSTNSSSFTNGGSLTIGGGAAIAEDLYIGGNLITNGTIPGQVLLTTPSIATSNLVSITTASSVNAKLRKVSSERMLTFALEITPSAVRSTCSVEFELPELVTNMLNAYDVIFSVNGYLVDFTPIENITVYGLVGDIKGKVRFTSGPSTTTHILQITASYAI